MKTIVLFFLLVCFNDCATAQDIRLQLQTQMIESPDGAVIDVPAGIFQMNMALWMDGKKNITIKGQGMDRTILSFRNQVAGAEGIKITNSINITLQDGSNTKVVYTSRCRSPNEIGFAMRRF